MSPTAARGPERAGAAAIEPSLWNVANALTVLRIGLVPMFAWLLLADGGRDSLGRYAAFVVFLLALLTDRADGVLARRHGLITNFGKIADPIADKALTGMAFVGLSLLGDLSWWVTGVVLAREWLVTLVRFLVLRSGVVIAASPGGKLKTVLQAVALSFYLLPLPDLLHAVGVAVMAAAVVVTVVTGVDYAVRALRLRRASG